MSSIEDRVSRLEKKVFGKERREKDWRSTVGMFGSDPFMDDVIDGALKSREEERQKARNDTDCDSK